MSYLCESVCELPGVYEEEDGGGQGDKGDNFTRPKQEIEIELLRINYSLKSDD